MTDTETPTALRDLCAAAIASYDHAVGQATDPAPRGHHYGQVDAVLAVRDRELELLRAQVARAQELCANYERWQSESWHPQQVTPGQAAREFRAALNPQEQQRCRRCQCLAGAPDCTHCNCCDVPDTSA